MTQKTQNKPIKHYLYHVYVEVFKKASNGMLPTTPYRHYDDCFELPLMNSKKAYQEFILMLDQSNLTEGLTEGSYSLVVKSMTLIGSNHGEMMSDLHEQKEL